MQQINKIDINEVLRYMGQHSNDPEMTLVAQKAIDDLSTVITPRYTYIKGEIHTDEKGIRVGSSNLWLTGQDIKQHLNNCSHLYILCATLGVSTDRHIKKAQYKGMLEALALDAAAADFIEKVCDAAENEIRATEQSIGFKITSRYSPGYGDLPISLQPEIVKVCDANKKIGLSVSDSGILIPRKSVTAIIGVSTHDVRGKLKGCGSCLMRETCNLRKAGKTCGA